MTLFQMIASKNTDERTLCPYSIITPSQLYLIHTEWSHWDHLLGFYTPYEGQRTVLLKLW